MNRPSTWFAVPTALTPSTASLFRKTLSTITPGLLLALALLLSTSAAQAQTVQHTFDSFPNDGYAPGYGALAKDCSGNLWGTTTYGGTATYGAIYELPYSSGPAYSFGSVTGDGLRPYNGLTLDNHVDPSTGLTLCQSYGTVFYGTTAYGGAYNQGTLFKYDAVTGTETKLQDFHVNGTLGGYPIGGVAIDSSGNIYGTSENGSTTGFCGVVWEYSSGSTTPFFPFPVSTSGGCVPVGTLMFDVDGNLWGTTSRTGYSGPNYLGYGTVFVFENSGGTLSSTLHTIHIFSGGGDGQVPYAGLSKDTSGNLYGTTFGLVGGGYCNGGTVYELTPTTSTSWNYFVLYEFPGYDSLGHNLGDGYYLYGGVAADSNGNVYGVTYNGGANAKGNLFKLTSGTSANACGGGAGLWTETVLHSFAGGSGDGSLGIGTPLLSGTQVYTTTYEGGSANVGVVFSIP